MTPTQMLAVIRDFASQARTDANERADQVDAAGIGSDKAALAAVQSCVFFEVAERLDRAAKHIEDRLHAEHAEAARIDGESEVV